MSFFGIELWVVLALGGGVAQTLRNVTAQTISSDISATLNSWSRFTFCLPYAALAAITLGIKDGWPELSSTFLGFCAITAVAQLTANVALITAFRSGSFGESIVFHKLEVVLTAIAGAMFFSEPPSMLGGFGIAVCAAGVIAINLAREDSGESAWRGLRFGRSGQFALLCAVLLVFASFALKLANGALRAANPEASFFDGAVQTLFHTTWIEVVILSLWILWREPASFREVGKHWKRMVVIGSAGFTASLCWFWAFSITIVAYAKAVGQIESLLAVALGIRIMGEKNLIRQLPGIALTLLGITLILLD
ncbi:MAG: EamA family transporter [bacterium]